MHFLQYRKESYNDTNAYETNTSLIYAHCNSDKN